MGGKTIVELPNRFRVDGNIMCDDFMQFERPLGVERAPLRLAAPHRVAWTAVEERVMSSVTIPKHAP